VDADLAALGQEVDEGAGQQGVLQGDAAGVAGADDMNRTPVEPQLFAHGAEIDEGADQHAGRLRGPQQGAGAVAGGQHQRAAAADGGRAFAGRVGQLEAGQRFAVALAAEKDLAGGQGVGQGPGLVDPGARPDADAAGGQSVDDG